MKKLIAAILIVATSLIISVYLFIPSKIVVANVRFLTAYQNGVTKFFDDSSMFNNWWRSVARENGNTYTFKGYSYQINGALSNLVKINIKAPSATTQSILVSLNIYQDSSAIQWSTEIKASLNPFERIKQYNQAKDLKANMAEIMDELKKYLDHSSNIYGIDVKEIEVKDSVLISTKMNTTAYPSVTEIYSLVNKLKDYAKSQQAGTTDYPMINVTKVDEKNYHLMAGLPINKVVEETNDIAIKRIPFMGKMFIANITGGNYTIQKSLDRLKEYYMDSRRASPAIPFELMVTDRLNEPDTTKWVTRLYFPIM